LREHPMPPCCDALLARNVELSDWAFTMPQRRSCGAMKLPPGWYQLFMMIRVALTDSAYDAIASTLPKGSARWPMQRDNGKCFIQVEAAVVDRMRAVRRPGESYSHVLLRLVELKTSAPS